jgi:hypothetical protein
VKIFLTVLGTVGGALWGYVLPGSFSTDWRWRLIALPAALLVGAIVWSRLQAEMPLFAVDVSMGRRIVITVAISLGSGFILPVALTHSWHPELGVLLGVPFALILGDIAWRNPAFFIRKTLF